MNTIDLLALSQLSFEDLDGFLPWLAALPAGEIGLRQLQMSPPIRSNKLAPLLVALEQFGLVTNKKDRVSPTPAGREYLTSTVATKQSLLRARLASVDAIRRIHELLGSSATGRLRKREIQEALDRGARTRAQPAEVRAFIAWAEVCGLCGYDEKREEIFRIEEGRPGGPDKEPRQLDSGEPGARLAS